jgi:hypothetical protein
MQSAYFLVDGRKYRKAAQVVRQFADRIIRRALERRETVKEKDSQAKYSVVEELVRTTQDPTEIRDQVIGIPHSLR